MIHSQSQTTKQPLIFNNKLTCRPKKLFQSIPISQPKYNLFSTGLALYFREINQKDKIICPWEESLTKEHESFVVDSIEVSKHFSQKIEQKTKIIHNPSTPTAPDGYMISNETTKESQIISKKNVVLKPTSWFYNTFRSYYELWKTRLSLLVVVTAIGGYYACGGRGWKALYVLLGTFLQAASANSINQVIEIERDKIMSRTKRRPLCTERISKFHAIAQAVIIGIGGTALLYFKTNPLTALLGLANILIYTGIYTPLKVIHPINTWVGTLNGSLPPLMGCTAATNTITDPIGLYMFAALYLWQITHFMAISYKCRVDYNAAGYKMLAIHNPDGAATHALIHSLLLLPLCWIMPYFGAPWWFALISTPINWFFLLKPAIKYKREVNYKNATSLFFNSLGHLSLLFTAQCITFCSKSIYNWIKNLFSS